MARTLLMYGPSGAFKTSNVGEAAEWLTTVRYPGTHVRAIYGDNYGPIMSKLMPPARDAGIIDLWDLRTTTDPLTCLLLVGKGWWPIQLEEGRAIPVKRNGKDVLLEMTSAAQWEKVSALVCEGFHENGVLIQRNLEAKQRSTGEPLVAEFGETVDGQNIAYAMSSRGTYGFVQNQTHRYFNLGFKSLPVPWVICTTHEHKGESKSGKKIVGPGIVGKAMTEEVPQWFDHVLHFDQGIYDVPLSPEAQKRTGEKTAQRSGTRAWFTKHSDAEIIKLLWPAKLGVEPWLMDYIFETWPKGYVPLVLKGQEYVSSVKTLLGIIDPVPEVSAGETE